MSGGAVSHHYNPDWLDDDNLVASFIARGSEFSFLRDELARVPREGSVQHFLLVGPRGAGKTTLLKRLAVAIRRDGDLSDHLIALSFPEELYQVKDLGDFWWAACEALADEFDRLGQKAPSAALFAAVDQARAGRPAAGPLTEADPKAGLARLLAASTEAARRPVLLVDNLDFIFERIDKQGRKRKDPLSPTYWALREALSTTSSPILIGASVRLSEPFTDYDKAFYDFFLTKRLGKLPLEEVRRLLEHLAERQNQTEIIERLKARPARIEALYELTGGNPRAIGLLFELLRQGPNNQAVEDFERLMDLTTPYYKHRFEDLSEQAQVVMHALAVRRPGDGGGLRFGHTAAEIAAHAGLPTNTVSAQMDVLEREGLVEKSATHGRTQYRIAEQLFRLWLQMRGTRRVRQNVIGLAEFLEAIFDMEELTAQLNDTSGGLAGARYAFALASMPAAAGLRHALEAYGTQEVFAATRPHGNEFNELLPPGDLPEDLSALLELRRRLRACGGGGLTPEEQETLIGALDLREEQKRAAVDALCNPESATAEATRLRRLFGVERSKLLRNGLLAEELPCLYKLRAEGKLPLPWLTPGEADIVWQTSRDPNTRSVIWRLVGAREWVKFRDDAEATAWFDWARRHFPEASSAEWANLARAFRRSRQSGAAGKALNHAFDLGESARAWHERGALLFDSGGNPREAEAALRKAIELDPGDALPWNNLGNLLAGKPARPEEAEAAYRKAIELDPGYAWPWNNLGNLLADKLARPEEAEAAYRKAIELDPGFAWPWNNLGILLAGKLARPEEAEAAYRKAIELDPGYALPWNNLGILLADKLARPEEAEAAYRKAIELDAKHGLAWGNLGVYLEKASRLDEASDAYAKAMEFDGLNAAHWRSRFRNLSSRRRSASVKKDVSLGDLAAVRSSLTELLSDRDNLPATLAAPGFVEELLAPTLADEQKASAILGLLWALGFDQYARPLLLAFEAAVKKNPKSLDDLEPEVRHAARKMHQRLMATHEKAGS